MPNTMKFMIYEFTLIILQIEKFKKSQSPKNALHSKFHVHTQDPLASEEEYGHLQVSDIFNNLTKDLICLTAPAYISLLQFRKGVSRGFK